MGKVTDVLAVLDTANSPMAIIELPEVRENSLTQYAALNPKGMDPAGYYELNRLAFADMLAGDKRLAKCPRMSIYNAWMELQISGLKLADGECYIIAEKKKSSDDNPRAKFRVSAKGKVQLMNRLPSINFVHEPQLIREGDQYQITNDPTLSISHTPSKDPIADRKVLHAYIVLDTIHGYKTFIMSYDEIIAARDFSTGYKFGDKKRSPWTTHFDRMAVKTMVNRAWNLVGEKETLHSMVADIANRASAEPEPEQETQDTDFRIVEEETPSEEIDTKDIY